MSPGNKNDSLMNSASKDDKEIEDQMVEEPKE